MKTNLPTSIAVRARNSFGFWFLLFSIITLIFFPAIKYPFFQDDFFILVTTRINSFADVWRLFKIVPEAVYWRPLSIQLYFGLMQYLGLGQPIWFHLVSLAVHLVNTYLVYKLILRDCHAPPAAGLAMTEKKRRIAMLAAFLWGTSPIHYFALGWAVNFSFILVATWVLLAVLAAREGKRFTSMVFFGLGLMTSELAIVTPGLVLLTGGRRRLRLAVSMSALAAVYAVWRILTGIKIEGDYALSLTETLSTLRWYGLWMLGWSDIVRDYLKGFGFSAEFVKTFPAVVWIYVVELVSIAILLFDQIRHPERSEGSRRDSSAFGLRMTLLWVGVALLPVMFFSRHVYSHYAAIAAIGVYWLMAVAVNRQRQWMMAVVVWLVVAMVSLGLNYQVSWMADHAGNSLVYQTKLRQRATELGTADILYIV